METKKTKISEFVRFTLVERGWSVARLAEETGVRYPSLTNFIYKEKSLSLRNLSKVFEALNIELVAK